MTTTLPQTTAAAASQAQASTPSRPRLPYPVRVALIGVAMLANIALTPMILGLPLNYLYNRYEMPLDLALALTQVMKMTPALGAIFLVWVYMRFIDRRPLREAGLVFTRTSAPLWLLGTVAAVVAVLPVGLLLQNAGLLHPDPSAIESVSPLWTFITAMVLGLFAQGFPEELLWRGYGLATMRLRPLTAVIVSALAFGSMHLLSIGGQQNVAEQVIYLIGPISFGLLAGVMAVSFRSIWPAVGVHFGHHLAYYLGSLFGMGTGPWLWVSAGSVFLILSAVCYVVFRPQFQTPITLDR